MIILFQGTSESSTNSKAQAQAKAEQAQAKHKQRRTSKAAKKERKWPTYNRSWRHFTIK